MLRATSKKNSKISKVKEGWEVSSHAARRVEGDLGCRVDEGLQAYCHVGDEKKTLPT